MDVRGSEKTFQVVTQLNSFMLDLKIQQREETASGQCFSVQTDLELQDTGRKNLEDVL